MNRKMLRIAAASISRERTLMRIPSAPASKPEATVRKIYRRLSRNWGPQHWWPAETPFEVIVGAILTQNTSWTNVERASEKLRQANCLSVAGIRALPLAELEQLVRSSARRALPVSRRFGDETVIHALREISKSLLLAG